MKKRCNKLLPLSLAVLLLLFGLAVGNILRLQTVRAEIERLTMELEELRSQGMPDDSAISIEEIELPPPPPQSTGRILFPLQDEPAL